MAHASELGSVLYLLHTSFFQQTEESTVATFADDTAIIGVRESVEEATEELRRTVDKVNKETRKWLIKLNETNSVHVDFSNKRCQHIPITINNKVIPHSYTPKCLDMTQDAKLRVGRHMSKKRGELRLKYKKMYWLM